jgi:hypothetical protein
MRSFIIGGDKKAYTILVEKSQGKRSLERDNENNNADDINDDINLIHYLFACLPNSPKANYKVSTSKERTKETQTKNKTK